MSKLRKLIENVARIIAEAEDFPPELRAKKRVRPYMSPEYRQSAKERATRQAHRIGLSGRLARHMDAARKGIRPEHDEYDSHTSPEASDAHEKFAKTLRKTVKHKPQQADAKIASHKKNLKVAKGHRNPGEFNVPGQGNEFYDGSKAPGGSKNPKGDITAVGDEGAPYASKCMCYGGKNKRLKIVRISCGYKKAYNKRYKDMHPHSGWAKVGSKKEKAHIKKLAKKGETKAGWYKAKSTSPEQRHKASFQRRQKAAERVRRSDLTQYAGQTGKRAARGRTKPYAYRHAKEGQTSPAKGARFGSSGGFDGGEEE